MAGRSDVGGRDHNEDEFLAEAQGGAAVVAVADGMGGHSAGDVASRMAIEGVRSRFSLSGLIENELEARLQEVFALVNEQIHSRGRELGSSMGTTLTVVLLTGGKLFLGHVGDSRAYLIRAGRIEQISLDHSVVAEALRSGQVSPEEARYIKKNALTRALGTRPAVQMDFHSREVQDGDLILLCSDGLSNVVNDHELMYEVGTHEVEPACEHLIELVKQRSGSDNATAVVLQVGTRPSPPPPPPAKPKVWIPALAVLILALVGACGYYFLSGPT